MLGSNSQFIKFGYQKNSSTYYSITFALTKGLAIHTNTHAHTHTHTHTHTRTHKSSASPLSPNRFLETTSRTEKLKQHQEREKRGVY